jgi:hypothetical protein
MLFILLGPSRGDWSDWEARISAKYMHRSGSRHILEDDLFAHSGFSSRNGADTVGIFDALTRDIAWKRVLPVGDLRVGQSGQHSVVGWNQEGQVPGGDGREVRGGRQDRQLPVGGGEVAGDGLLQLGFDPIRDDHQAVEEGTAVDAIEVAAQDLEDADLQHAGFGDEHGHGVALSAALAAMEMGGDGGVRRGGVDRLLGTESLDEVFQQTMQVAGAFGWREVGLEEKLVASGVIEEELDGGLDGGLEDIRDGLDGLGFERSGGQAAVDGGGQRGDVASLENDLVGLADDGLGGDLHLGKAGEQYGDGLGVGVAHGADDGEAVAGTGHVEVAKEDVEGSGEDEFKRLMNAFGRGDVVAKVCQQRGQGGEDHLVVIDEQDLWVCLLCVQGFPPGMRGRTLRLELLEYDDHLAIERVLWVQGRGVSLA